MSRPVIGSAYQRTHYERRTPTEYSALRPPVMSDALRLQQSLIRRGRRADPEGVVGTVAWVVTIVLVVLFATGTIS